MLFTTSKKHFSLNWQLEYTNSGSSLTDTSGIGQLGDSTWSDSSCQAPGNIERTNSYFGLGGQLVGLGVRCLNSTVENQTLCIVANCTMERVSGGCCSQIQYQMWGPGGFTDCIKMLRTGWGFGVNLREFSRRNNKTREWWEKRNTPGRNQCWQVWFPLRAPVSPTVQRHAIQVKWAG